MASLTTIMGDDGVAGFVESGSPAVARAAEKHADHGRDGGDLEAAAESLLRRSLGGSKHVSSFFGVFKATSSK